MLPNLLVNRPRRLPQKFSSVANQESEITSSPWWKGVWIGGLVSSSAVAVMAALQGRVEGRPFCNPLNAISHIVGGAWRGKAEGMDVPLHGSWIAVERGGLRLLGRFLPSLAPNFAKAKFWSNFHVSGNWDFGHRIYHRLLRGATAVYTRVRVMPFKTKFSVALVALWGSGTRTALFHSW